MPFALPSRPYSPLGISRVRRYSPTRVPLGRPPLPNRVAQGSKGDVAVFWDLDKVSPQGNPVGAFSTIRHLASGYGKVAHAKAYIGCDPGWKQASTLDILMCFDVMVRVCPKRGNKPTIHHTIEEDIAFHVAIDHPETRTVVFVTGDRDFTYCSQTLRRNGLRVVVLILNKAGNIVETDPDTYWPLRAPEKVRSVKRASGGGRRQVQTRGAGMGAECGKWPQIVSGIDPRSFPWLRRKHEECKGRVNVEMMDKRPWGLVMAVDVD